MWGREDIEKLISIHAPAWGATHNLRQGRGSSEFQSTPPRGGRLKRLMRAIVRAYFNPRPRVGGDLLALKGADAVIISIHAPAWGATPASCAYGLNLQFQSTPPRGGRLECLKPFTLPILISIHAPAWGATHAASHAAGADRISIHAPAWGATAETSGNFGIGQPRHIL